MKSIKGLNKMRLIVDWAEDFDDEEELLMNTFDFARSHNCIVTIMSLEGPGGYWPEVRFEGEYDDLKKLALDYGMDEEEFKELVEFG